MENRPNEAAVTLLVVDDDEDVRALFADFLRDEGYEVLEASSAREAKERLAENAASIALVLTDLRMPGENGLDLVKYVHQQYLNIPILLMSGDTKGANTEGEPLLLKPISLDRLALAVGDLLNQAPQRQSCRGALKPRPC